MNKIITPKNNPEWFKAKTPGWNRVAKAIRKYVKETRKIYKSDKDQRK